MDPRELPPHPIVSSLVRMLEASGERVTPEILARLEQELSRIETLAELFHACSSVMYAAYVLREAGRGEFVQPFEAVVKSFKHRFEGVREKLEEQTRDRANEATAEWQAASDAPVIKRAPRIDEERVGISAKELIPNPALARPPAVRRPRS